MKYVFIFLGLFIVYVTFFADAGITASKCTLSGGWVQTFADGNQYCQLPGGFVEWVR